MYEYDLYIVVNCIFYSFSFLYDPKKCRPLHFIARKFVYFSLGFFRCAENQSSKRHANSFVRFSLLSISFYPYLAYDQYKTHSKLKKKTFMKKEKKLTKKSTEFNNKNNIDIAAKWNKKNELIFFIL